jgi:uncharacterized membrane protein YccC
MRYAWGMSDAVAPYHPPRRRFDLGAIGRLWSRLLPAEVWPDAARMTIASVGALLATKALHMPGTFAVLTALMATRQGAGGGFKAVLDRLIGMALGVSVGLALVTARPHVPDAVLVTIAMLPLCVVVARFRKYQAAPIGAILVLSAGAVVSTALHAAMMRVSEICLGAAIGIAVSAIVFRRATQDRSIQHAGRVLTGCGALMVTVAARTPAQSRDFALRERIRGDLRLAMKSSKATPIGSGPKLAQTQLIALGRLHTDISGIGRALGETRLAWRDNVQPVLERLADAFQDVCEQLAEHLLGADAAPPSLAVFDGAMVAFRQRAAEQGVQRADEAATALPFLLLQLRADVIDLLPAAA